MKVHVMVVGEDADEWIKDAKTYEPSATFVHVTEPEHLRVPDTAEPVLVLHRGWQKQDVAREMDADGKPLLAVVAEEIVTSLVVKWSAAYPKHRRPTVVKRLVAIASEQWNVWKNTAKVDYELKVAVDADLQRV